MNLKTGILVVVVVAMFAAHCEASSFTYQTTQSGTGSPPHAPQGPYVTGQYGTYPPMVSEEPEDPEDEQEEEPITPKSEEMEDEPILVDGDVEEKSDGPRKPIKGSEGIYNRGGPENTTKSTGTAQYVLGATVVMLAAIF